MGAWFIGCFFYTAMAENKKSFVLYADLLHTFKYLSLEQRGLVFTWILEYVNDMNPEPLEGLLQAVAEPIKQQLKRDLKKYQKKQVQWSEAGKRSAEVRKANKNKRPLTTVKSRSTDLTVNVNDTVNVTVNDILLEKETKELFNNWLEYRKEIKKPIKSKRSIIALAKKIQSEGFKKSKSVIETSIENGWQGLFWDKQSKTEQKQDDNKIRRTALTQEEQDLQKQKRDDKYVSDMFDYYKSKKIIPEQSIWVYDYLVHSKNIQLNGEDKKQSLSDYFTALINDKKHVRDEL